MLDMLHKPEPLDPSHAGIFGLLGRQLIAELIAEVVQDVYPAKPA